MILTYTRSYDLYDINIHTCSLAIFSALNALADKANTSNEM